MHVPDSWFVQMPSLFEMAGFLKNVTLEKARVLSDLQVHHVWRAVPSWVRIINQSHTGWYTNTTESRVTMAEQFCNNIIAEGQFNNTPVELAKRFEIFFVFQYGQCVRNGHKLHLDSRNGAEPSQHIGDPQIVQYLLNEGVLHPRFMTQVAVCGLHEQDICSTCGQSFKLLEQEIRFWGIKSIECQECLRHSLMFVQAHHNARKGIVRTPNGRRKLFRKTNWVVDYAPMPSGTDIPAPIVTPGPFNWSTFIPTEPLPFSPNGGWPPDQPEPEPEDEPYYPDPDQNDEEEEP